MSKRTHLSIGEVLTLLSDDFPDLTITKIRFLESQGLISPERTASGYRKFYESDIERLRWILRQQRDNFLPLKVIKDRLDRSEGRDPTMADDSPGQAELDLARDPGPADPPPVWMADHAAAQVRSNGDAPTSTPSATSAPGKSGPGPEPLPEPLPETTSSAVIKAAPIPGPAPERAPEPARVPPTPAAPPRAAAQAEPKPSPEAPVPTEKPAPRSADLTDVSMTRSELLGAAHLEERQLTELESYGIVVASPGPDEPFYGATALVCARQAKTFLDLGVEPRHLRAFKVAADREAGLYEQLVAPLLRRRNAESRSEAAHLVDKLTRSGATIHAALLQQALRSQVRRGR